MIEIVEIDDRMYWVVDEDLLDDLTTYAPSGTIETIELFEIFEDWLEDQF